MVKSSRMSYSSAAPFANIFSREKTSVNLFLLNTIQKLLTWRDCTILSLNKELDDSKSSFFSAFLVVSQSPRINDRQRRFISKGYAFLSSLRATQNRIDDTNARIVKYIKKYTDERDFVPEYIGPNILTPEGDAPEL